MKFRSLLCLLAVAFPMALIAAEEAPPPAPKRSIWQRVLHPFGGSKTKEPKVRGTNLKNLEMALEVEPKVVKLADHRLIKVTLTLTNRGGKLAQLEFPTSQRVEVLLKEPSGQMIEQWSQDQAFISEPTLVAINPRERLEYSVNVATRDMKPGASYTVEGFFPNFDALRKTRTVTVEN